MATVDTGPVLRPVCGVVARDARGHVLLIRRADDRTWGLPGGGVEPGESWAEAARRECLEETGWQVVVHDIFGVYSDPATQLYRYPGGRETHFVGVVFAATPVRRIDTVDDEASAVGFFPVDALPQPLFGPDRPILDDLRSQAPGPFVG